MIICKICGIIWLKVGEADKRERRTEITELPERVFGENTQIQLHIDRENKTIHFLRKAKTIRKAGDLH